MSKQQQKDMLTRLDEQIEFFTARRHFSYVGFFEECKKEIEQLRQQIEEAERDRDSFADGLLLAVFYSKCPACGEYIDSGLHHPDCKYTKVIARARTVVYRQQPQGGEDE